MNLPLATVLGTKGVERHAITFHGQEAHSGSTPMNARRDALAAAAKLALEIRTIAGKHPDAVCTMGSVKTFPGIVTAVVGRCETALDQRDLDPAVLAQMYREAREASERFAAEEKCTVEWSRIWSIEPIAFHPRLLDLCDAAISEVTGTPKAHRMPSGPLHDAAEVSRAGIPTVMMFVQSLGGISHNKVEDTKEEHLELCVSAFDRLASKAMDFVAQTLDSSDSCTGAAADASLSARSTPCAVFDSIMTRSAWQPSGKCILPTRTYVKISPSLVGPHLKDC